VHAKIPRRIPVPDFSIPVPDLSMPVPAFSIPVPDFSIPVPDFSIPVPLFSIIQRDILFSPLSTSLGRARVGLYLLRLARLLNIT
jgi:hypothetical protein